MPKITDEPADAKFGMRFHNVWMQSKYCDLNQTELAKVFGYSKQGINFIVNGHRYPHLSSGLKMAKEFNCSMDWLYTGREPMRMCVKASQVNTSAWMVFFLHAMPLKP